jgi:hypothetical protein
METEESEDVLRFWFPDLSSADHARMVHQFDRIRIGDAIRKEDLRVK